MGLAHHLVVPCPASNSDRVSGAPSESQKLVESGTVPFEERLSIDVAGAASLDVTVCASDGDYELETAYLPGHTENGQAERQHVPGIQLSSFQGTAAGKEAFRSYLHCHTVDFVTTVRSRLNLALVLIRQGLRREPPPAGNRSGEFQESRLRCPSHAPGNDTRQSTALRLGAREEKRPQPSQPTRFCLETCR
jgi:hypothetical protein